LETIFAYDKTLLRRSN